MCIICIEFNRNRDLEDAWRMLDAAGREPNSIAAQHLEKVKSEISKIQANPKSAEHTILEIED